MCLLLDPVIIDEIGFLDESSVTFILGSCDFFEINLMSNGYNS